VQSLVALIPAAAWDEREAADLSEVNFEGHNTVPLITHPEQLERWVTPVRGPDTHQVAVGPIHAGIIESGHFRFHVVGERILHLDLRLFYKRRGLEHAAEGRSLAEGLAIVARSCAACTVANSLAYVHACEQSLGLAPTPEVARARTILAELERCYNHLHDLAAAFAGIGFALGNQHFASLKERAQRVNLVLTGHRFCFHTVHLGANELTITPQQAADAQAELRAIASDAQRGWRDASFNGSVQNRFRGIGLLTAADVDRLGVVGPSARASGVATDARTHSPRLAYRQFTPAMLLSADGDVRSRIEQRAIELPATIDILVELLEGGIEPAACTTVGEPVDTGMAVVESPRGRTFCSVERTGDTIKRVRLRTSSYANWPVVAIAATGEILPEFPLINKSFELCYACSDR
jgi:Ni,Fe-hydrogenase III large subunit